MANTKFKFSDIIDIVKLLIVLLPLIREFLETINNWSEADKSVLKELISKDE